MSKFSHICPSAPGIGTRKRSVKRSLKLYEIGAQRRAGLPCKNCAESLLAGINQSTTLSLFGTQAFVALAEFVHAGDLILEIKQLRCLLRCH